MRFVELFGGKGHFAGVLCEKRPIKKTEDAPVLGGRKSSCLPEAREGREQYGTGTK